mmetsp:Transcript_2041/g.2917  ORF Transcript_2041/g.2917 Transcript_2041/m.2917 type:complete len:280 (+) Transcript_2041:37-876(+)
MDPSAGKSMGGGSRLPSWIVSLKSPKPYGGMLYMVGTSHVSKVSQMRVRQAINMIKPGLVMLELCKKRKNMLKAGTPKSCCSLCRNLTQVALSGHMGLAVFGYLLSKLMQRAAEEVGVHPGEDLKVAADEARRHRASLILGDRDFLVTVRRMWCSLTPYEQMCLCAELYYTTYVSSRWSSLTDSKYFNKWLGKRYPSLVKPLITERDAYMAHVLRYFVDQGKTVVAVVGEAHVQGICEQWEKETDVQKLLHVPSNSQIGAIRLVCALVIVLCLFYLFTY